MDVRLGIAGAVLLLLAGRAPAQQTGYEALLHWSDLPAAKAGVTAGLADSYDRAGGNYDYNQYESPAGFQSSAAQTVETLPTLVTEITGPGILTRFWMPHAVADEGFDVKVTIDGAAAPVIDTTSDVFLGGGYGYVSAPLVQTLVGGQVSYEPIVFTQSLRIESNNFDTGDGSTARTHHYYQYNYHRLDSAGGLTAYSGALTTAQQEARAAVASQIQNVGANPGGTSGSAVTLCQPAEVIQPGEALTLADLAGGGCIRRLNVKMQGAGDEQLDGLRLRVRYDGLARNAIDVPVSHFFGAGHGRVPYRSFPLGTQGDDGFYSYWPMPFGQGVVVELYNAGGAAVGIDSAAVEYEASTADPDAYYLHVVYNSVESTTDPQYRVLRASGRGHYVGNLLWLDRQRNDYYGRAVLEGDDVITVNVDGDSPTVLCGTGLEDAYNGGYYYNHVLEHPLEPKDPYSGAGAYSGLLRMNFAEPGGGGDGYVHTDQYRWLIGDYVPFAEGIDVSIEHFYPGYGASFGSTAFYYAAPILLGDLDGDGAVNNNDITPFVLALTDPDGYLSQYPGVDREAVGDVNQDGAFNNNDITPFVELLTGSRNVAVPEPAAIGLLLGAPAMLRGRSRRD